MVLVNVVGFNKFFVLGLKVEWFRNFSIKLNFYFLNYIFKMIKSIWILKNIFIVFIYFVYKCILFKYF